MRAQIWSIDFAVSILIFMSVIILVFFTWSYTSTQSSEQVEINNMQTSALLISDSLIRVEGLPRDWNATNVKVIGIASRNENVLNKTKVDRFLNLSYSKARGLLGIGAYEFYFELSYMNHTIMKNQDGNNITKGNYPDSSASIIVPAERYVLYNGKIARLKFWLWR